MKPFLRYILTFYLALFTLSSNAQFIWQTTLGTNGTDLAKDFIITNDGNYLSLGTSAGDSIGVYFSKIDTSGNILWQRWHIFNVGMNFGFNPLMITETLSGEIIVGGNKLNIWSTSVASMFAKLNSNGDTLYTIQDTSVFGSAVSRLISTPDNKLLSLVKFNNANSLIKIDTNFNVLNRIDNITKPIKGLEVINNIIYVLLGDSINNLLMINSNLTQIDTVTVPMYFPVYLRKSFNKTELIVDGVSMSISNSPRKLVFLDLLGNIISTCDSAFSKAKDDFQPIDANNNWLYVNQKYIPQYGRDIQLFFTDKCGAVQFDTILPRWSFTEELHEQVKKVLVDANGNYLMYGYVTSGPLGGNDIFLFNYKKMEFPTVINDSNESISIFDSIIIYPNPFHHQLTINGLEQNVIISILDVTGRIIYQFNSPSSSYMVNTSSWANGLYLVTIKGLTSTTVLKVVKQ